MTKKTLDQVTSTPERVTKVIDIKKVADHELYVEIGHDREGNRIQIITNSLNDAVLTVPVGMKVA